MRGPLPVEPVEPASMLWGAATPAAEEPGDADGAANGAGSAPVAQAGAHVLRVESERSVE